MTGFVIEIIYASGRVEHLTAEQYASLDIEAVKGSRVRLVRVH